MSARLELQIEYDASPSAITATMAAMTVAHAEAFVKVSPPGWLAAPWRLSAAMHARGFVMPARIYLADATGARKSTDPGQTPESVTLRHNVVSLRVSCRPASAIALGS